MWNECAERNSDIPQGWYDAGQILAAGAEVNNKFRVFFLISLAIALAAYEKEAPQETSAGSDEPTLSPLEQGLAQIGRDGIESHLKFLADDARMGRMTGTPQYDEAAAYVAERFAEIGLEPGGDDGWYQQVPMLARRIDVDSAKFVFHINLRFQIAINTLLGKLKC